MPAFNAISAAPERVEARLDTFPRGHNVDNPCSRRDMGLFFAEKLSEISGGFRNLLAWQELSKKRDSK